MGRTSWTQANIPPGATELRGVSAASASDVWAVGDGTSISGTSGSGAFLQHFDGTGWVQKPGPDLPAGVFSVLRAVQATSANDAWTVGDTFGNATKALILYWDGTRWTQASSPSPGSGINQLNAVAREPGGGALWAAGRFAALGGVTFQALAAPLRLVVPAVIGETSGVAESVVQQVGLGVTTTAVTTTAVTTTAVTTTGGGCDAATAGTVFDASPPPRQPGATLATPAARKPAQRHPQASADGAGDSFSCLSAAGATLRISVRELAYRDCYQ